jgi:hypothetical protein
MAGYLEQYGAGDERRAKITKIAVLVAVVLLLGSGIIYFFFHNYPEEREASRFFRLLQAHDYKAAYALWGCTDAKPCREYPISEFMKDWGPDAAPVSEVEVLDGESCGSGVIVEVGTGKAGDKKLWVERSNHVLGFPPFPQCPQGNRIHELLRNMRYRLHGRSAPAAGS